MTTTTRRAITGLAIAATAAWRGQVTRWSLTSPQACMKA